VYAAKLAVAGQVLRGGLEVNGKERGAKRVGKICALGGA
jgi:hypothetical protein